MSDLVERLRDTNRPDAMLMSYQLRREAADEIERLRADNKFLVESVEKHVAAGIRLGERAKAAEAKLATAVKALEPFAAKSGTLHSGYDDGIAAGDSPYVSVPVKHLRKAESTLKEIGGAS